MDSLRVSKFDIIYCQLNLFFSHYFSVTDVISKLKEYVDDLNANIEKLDTRGPVSKYVLPDENLKGRCVSFTNLIVVARFVNTLIAFCKNVT